MLRITAICLLDMLRIIRMIMWETERVVFIGFTIGIVQERMDFVSPLKVKYKSKEETAKKVNIRGKESCVQRV